MAKIGVIVELFYSGAWHDITSDVYTRDLIRITRGRPDAVQRIPPSTLSLSLDSRDGQYSPRNPMSTLYGLIGRNTPIRVSVQGYDVIADSFTRTVVDGWGTSELSNLEWALSGTGGIANSDFQVSSGVATQFMPNTLDFRHSTLDGFTIADVTAMARCNFNTTDITGTDGVEVGLLLRYVDIQNFYMLRAILNPNQSVTAEIYKTVANGYTLLSSGTVSGLTYTGQWLRLKAQASGTTFRLKVWDDTGSEPTSWTLTTTDATFSAGTVGVRSGVGSGNTNTTRTFRYANFTLDPAPRFVGEVESWPQRWNVKGTDVSTPITANGIMRRLNAPGTTRPTLSALRRTLSVATFAGLLGWWPLEDVGQALTSAPSALSSGADMSIVDSFVTRSVDDTLPGAAPVPKVTLGVGAAIGASNFGGVAPDMVDLLPSSGNSWSMLFWTRTTLLEDNPSTTTITVQLKITGSAQIDTWFFTMRQNNFSVAARVEVDAFATNAAGSVVTAVSFAAAATVGYVDGWRAFRVNVDLSGTDHRLRIWLDETLVGTVTAAGNTPGQPSRANVNAQVTVSAVPVSFGQLLFSGGTGSDLIDDNATQLVAAGRGYSGDTAVARMTRLCSEEGLQFTVTGDDSQSQPVGVQRVAAVLDLLQDAADVDGGVLYEPRNFLGLTYRPHNNLYNQTPVLDLDYAAGGEVGPPLEPVEDTDATANDVTVKRDGGASANVVQETGPLNVQEPSADPDGVGRYAKAITLILATDEQCLSQAAWRKHLGTWDEARYPVVNVDLTAMAADGKTALIGDAASLDIGHRFTIANPPAWLPPDDIEQHAQGFTETIESHRWSIAANATPALPYEVLQLETGSGNRSRIPTGGSTLAGTMTTTSTSRTVTSSGQRWIDSATYPAQFPFDILVAGERMTVTAITGTSSPQTFTVTRSVNGIVKTHAASEPVQLFHPSVIAR